MSFLSVAGLRPENHKGMIKLVNKLDDNTYIILFYDMVMAQIFKVLKDANNKDFANDLLTVMKSRIEALKETTTGNSDFMKKCRGFKKILKGLTFAERTVSVKVRGGEHFGFKVKSINKLLKTLKTTIDDIANDKDNSPMKLRLFLKSQLTECVTNPFVLNLTFQLLFDSLGDTDIMVKHRKSFFYEGVQLGFDRLFGESENPYKGVWYICKKVDEQFILNDKIFGPNKPWFGEDEGEWSENPKEFNEKVLKLLANEETEKKFCELLGFRIDYMVQKFSIPDDAYEKYRTKIEKILKHYDIPMNEIENLLIGCVKFIQLEDDGITPFGFYMNSDTKTFTGTMIGKYAKSIRNLPVDIWNTIDVFHSTLAVSHISILETLGIVKEDDKHKYPSAYFAIQSNALKYCKEQSDRIINMSRLLRYFRTGVITGHFDEELFVKVIENLPIEHRNGHETVEIVKLSSSNEKEKEFELKERCYKATWEKYIAAKTDGEQQKVYIPSLEFPKGGFTKEDIQALPIQIYYSFMCQYYCFPYIITTENKYLIAGSKIAALLNKTFVHDTSNINIEYDAEGKMTIVDKNGNKVDSVANTTQHTEGSRVVKDSDGVRQDAIMSGLKKINDGLEVTDVEFTLPKFDDDSIPDKVTELFKRFMDEAKKSGGVYSAIKATMLKDIQEIKTKEDAYWFIFNNKSNIQAILGITRYELVAIMNLIQPPNVE